MPCIKCAYTPRKSAAHASGFIAAVYPLVQQGIVAKDAPLAAYSLTGYSGGGKKMIAEYEAPDRDARCKSDRIYATNLRHKHLPEMQAVCGLTQPPVFSPVVGDYFRGMATTLLLPGVSAAAAHEALARHYEGQAPVLLSQKHAAGGKARGLAIMKQVMA